MPRKKTTRIKKIEDEKEKPEKEATPVEGAPAKTKKTSTKRKTTTKRKTKTSKTEDATTEKPAKTEKKEKTSKTTGKTKKKTETKSTKTKKKTETKAEKPKEPEEEDILSKRAERYERPKVVIQPEINIGTIGHVDNGKSTLVQALTGKFPDEHSEELRRGITIRLGYADAEVRECPKCKGPERWTTEKKCPVCGSKTKLIRKISFVDCPGHEILMRTMLSGASLMDGVLLVIAANQRPDLPQTREHLAAITALGIDKVIVVQNKIELASREDVIENYKQIKQFLKGTIAENAPIIPVSAMHRANIDLLLQTIQEYMPTPKRDDDAPALMMAARSFDINKPGTRPEDLKGGVLGGSIATGVIRVGDEVTIVPGLKKKGKSGIEYIPVTTTVTSIVVGTRTLSDEARPGGLVALGTLLDPSMTRSDFLAGSVIAHKGHEPPVYNEINLKYKLFDHVVGAETPVKVEPLRQKEPLMLTVGTSSAIGVVTKLKKGIATITLKAPVALLETTKIAISRRFDQRFRLIGYGELVTKK